MRDTKQLTKLMDKHNLHLGNREDEVLLIIIEHFPDVYAKAKQWAIEDGNTVDAKPHLVDHTWEALDIKDEKIFLETLDKNLLTQKNEIND